MNGDYGIARLNTLGYLVIDVAMKLQRKNCSVNVKYNKHKHGKGQ